MWHSLYFSQQNLTVVRYFQRNFPSPKSVMHMIGLRSKCNCVDRLDTDVSTVAGLCSVALFQAEHIFLAAGRFEIGVNDHVDDDSSSQEGHRSWSELSHTEPLSMTVSHYPFS